MSELSTQQCREGNYRKESMTVVASLSLHRTLDTIFELQRSLDDLRVVHTVNYLGGVHMYTKYPIEWSQSTYVYRPLIQTL